MIDKVVLKLLSDVIKSMKCDRYIITNGCVIGARVMRNKKQFDVIESIAYTNIGISVNRMYSFADFQFKDLMKSKVIENLNEYDELFDRIFDDPLIVGNFQLLMAFNNTMSLLNNKAPSFTVDNLKENEKFLEAYSNKSKYGLKFIIFERFIIPSYKAICSSTKKDPISLKVYEDINYIKYGSNGENNNSTILDYVVNKKKYEIHNLYRIIPI